MEENMLFDNNSLAIGGATTSLWCLFGTTVNGMVIFMILNRSKIKQHLTSPVLFIMCASNFLFSLFSMPVQSYRFFVKDNWTPPNGTFCKTFPISRFIHSSISIYLLSQHFLEFMKEKIIFLSTKA